MQTSYRLEKFFQSWRLEAHFNIFKINYKVLRQLGDALHALRGEYGP